MILIHTYELLILVIIVTISWRLSHVQKYPHTHCSVKLCLTIVQRFFKSKEGSFMKFSTQFSALFMGICMQI